MRSKKFAGELCVYCNSSPAVVPDHVFAREFFLVNQRDKLPQVPACDKCNNEKSHLEHYLTALLPFGGSHADVVAWLHRPFPAIAMILFIGTAFHHTYHGLKNVIDDYVHTEGVKFAAIIVIAFACFALAVAGIFAVLKIAFGS